MIDLTTNKKNDFDYKHVNDTEGYTTYKKTEYALNGVIFEVEDEGINQAHHTSIEISESKVCASSDENERALVSRYRRYKSYYYVQLAFDKCKRSRCRCCSRRW